MTAKLAQKMRPLVARLVPKITQPTSLKTALVTGACRWLKVVFDVAGWLRSGRKPARTLASIAPGARVLIVKPCCLGDVILATATVRAISQTRPDLKLEFLVSDWSRAALENNPRLAALVPTGVAGSEFSWRQFGQLTRRLRRAQYAAVLVLDRSPRLNLLAWLAGIPLRAGLDSQHRGFALNLRAVVSPMLKSEAEVYLDVARVAGATVAEPRLEFYTTEREQATFEQKAAQLGLDLAAKLVVIHPGGGHNPDTKVLSKRWPAARFGEIASRLQAGGRQVVVIGAATDRELAEVVTGISGAFNACEQFSLAETGVLLARTSLFIGNDTGVMHLAAACGAAVLAIYGPSSPVAYAPYTQQAVALAPVAPTVRAGLPLKEYETLSAAEGGIYAVTVEQVWQALAGLDVAIAHSSAKLNN